MEKVDELVGIAFHHLGLQPPTKSPLRIKISQTTPLVQSLVNPIVSMREIHQLDHSISEGSQYTVLEASGNENDCLIHSFLTSTSPRIFGAIPTSQLVLKNMVAGYIRRTILPYILRKSSAFPSTLQESIIEELQGDGFLSERIIGVLCTLFSINYLLIQPSRRGIQGGTQVVEPAQITVTIPQGIEEGLSNQLPTFLIYCSGVHFEPVIFYNRTNGGGSTDCNYAVANRITSQFASHVYMPSERVQQITILHNEFPSIDRELIGTFLNDQQEVAPDSNSNTLLEMVRQILRGMQGGRRNRTNCRRNKQNRRTMYRTRRSKH